MLVSVVVEETETEVVVCGDSVSERRVPSEVGVVSKVVVTETVVVVWVGLVADWCVSSVVDVVSKVLGIVCTELSNDPLLVFPEKVVVTLDDAFFVEDTTVL